MQCDAIKIGDTLSWVAPIEILIDGVPEQDLSAWTAVCEFRRRATNELLSAAVVNIVGGFLTIEADTSTWKPGAAIMDIRFLLNGTVRSTCTHEFQVVRAVTEVP